MIPADVLYFVFVWLAAGAAWWWIDGALRGVLRLKQPGPEYVVACALGGLVAVLVMVLALIRMYRISRRPSVIDMMKEASNG